MDHISYWVRPYAAARNVAVAIDVGHSAIVQTELARLLTPVFRCTARRSALAIGIEATHVIAKPLEPPANAFSHRFVVSAADIDDLGHAGNVRWVQWVQDAASAHSIAVGLGLPEYQAFGLLWVVRRHDIEYLGAAFEGDA